MANNILTLGLTVFTEEWRIIDDSVNCALEVTYFKAAMVSIRGIASYSKMDLPGSLNGC